MRLLYSCAPVSDSSDADRDMSNAIKPIYRHVITRIVTSAGRLVTAIPTLQGWQVRVQTFSTRGGCLSTAGVPSPGTCPFTDFGFGCTVQRGLFGDYLGLHLAMRGCYTTLGPIRPIFTPNAAWIHVHTQYFNTSCTYDRKNTRGTDSRWIGELLKIHRLSGIRAGVFRLHFRFAVSTVPISFCFVKSKA